MASKELLELDRIHGDLPELKSRIICWTPEQAALALMVAKDCTFAATDVETIPYKKPAGKKSTVETAKPENTRIYALTVVSYSFLRESDGLVYSFAFPLQKSKNITGGLPTFFECYLSTIREINALARIRWTLHNGAYDLAWFIYFRCPLTNYAYDSMTMFWSRWPDLPKRLDFVTSVLLDSYRYWKGERKSDDYAEYMSYAMSDTESTLYNTIILARYMHIDSKMRRNFFFAHMRCLSGINMSARGMAVDESVMDELAEKLAISAKEKLEKFRYLIADSNFNPNSAPQKKRLIYTILKAKPRGPKGKYTSLDKASCGAMALRAIRNDHVIFRRVINAMLDSIKPAKQISNVIKMSRFKAGSTGSRFLTSYDGVGTTTTRYASRASAFGHGSNGQNVQKYYRRFARADKGCFYIEVDLSAADDAFIAFESEEQKKIDLFHSGKDTHAVNALIFFTDWTYERIVAGKKAKDPRVVDSTTGIRQITKKAVHGSHYLMAGHTLLASAGREAIVAAASESGYPEAAGWDQDRLALFCEYLDNKFRNHYPRFQREQAGPSSWYYDLRRELLSTGGFTTAFGYFQRFLSDPKDDATLRAVAATAGQGGTAGRVNTILDEQIHGYIPSHFRDGENPHRFAKPNRVSDVLNGISTRQQTHDSIGYNVNPRHPKWESGITGIFETFSRPLVIKGREFALNWEGDISIFWAGEEGVEFKSVDNPTIENVHAILEEISSKGLL